MPNCGALYNKNNIYYLEQQKENVTGIEEGNILTKSVCFSLFIHIWLVQTLLLWLHMISLNMNHGIISMLPFYENIRLHKHQQEITETCLQVLNFEVDGFWCQEK